MVQTALNRKATYRVFTQGHFVELSEFMKDIKFKAINQLESTLKRFHRLKGNMKLAGLYFLSNQQLSDVKTFLNANEVIAIGLNLDE